MFDSGPTCFSNARLVLADRVVPGWLVVEAGRIAALGGGTGPRNGFDCDGDYLLPGLVELHTDHLEAHVMPRPHVRWSLAAAVVAYDAQIACAGITTVFDSLRLGGEDVANIAADAGALAGAVRRAADGGLLRVEHRTHLRCEVATDDVVVATERFMAEHPAHLMSLMDHTPGQRQFRDLAKARHYFARLGVGSDEAWAALAAQRQSLHDRYAGTNRRSLVALARDRAVALASHDDGTPDEVAEAVADEVSIAEFPTTREAAALSHAAGIAVLMGAPNVVRGGSHAGNVAAGDLATSGTLDILSSDYVPNSLLLAAFALPGQHPGLGLADAVRLVTRNPARAAGLADRGTLEPGLRADLIRVREGEGGPSLRGVWREGFRVA